MRGLLYGLLANQITASSITDVQNFRVTDATQTSITVGFDENYNYDTVVTCHPDCNDNVSFGSGNRTFHGLQSGKLYTFVAFNADADNADIKSEPVTVNQDTIPPAPDALSLSTFEILEVEIKFFGVPVPHRVETNGVLAEWEDPIDGQCDCYDAIIDPSDGIAIEPKTEEGEYNEGQKSRQFIHLFPGKEYDVSVWGKTCGNGQIANLKSATLNEKIAIPPESPGKGRLRSRDSDKIEICFGGPVEGYFTGFDFEWVNSNGQSGSDFLQVNDEDDTYNYRNEDRQYCHTLTGLDSCTKYNIQIYTNHDGVRSSEFTLMRIETLPQQPTGLRLRNYDSDSVHIAWNKQDDAQGFLVNVKPDDHNVTVSNTSYRANGLSPGQKNEFEVQAYCILVGERRGQPVEYKLWSLPASVAQSTLPEPPAEVTASCNVGASSVDMNRDMSIFNARLNQEIIMNLDWQVPETGHWDGFVITYSPFIVAPENPDYIPPFTYPAGVTSARINLPRTDQIYTVYVRAISDNVESEAKEIKLVCGEPTPSSKQCLQKAPKLANVDLGHNNVEINLDHLAMDDSLWGNLFSADDPMTPQLEFRGGNGHTGKSVIIRSDNINCAAIECNSLKLNFNVCTAGFGCEQRFIAAACPCHNPDKQWKPNNPSFMPDSPTGPGLGARMRPSHVMGDSCCGDKSYSSAEQTCCHDQLYDRDGDENCCGSQKYNKKLFKCCGSEKGWGLATIEGTCDDALTLPEKPRNLLQSLWRK